MREAGIASPEKPPASHTPPFLQRFAVLRTIGFSLNQLLAVATIEYTTVIVYGVGSGVLLGVTASHLFVPFFQLTEDPSLPVPPFIAEIAWGEIWLLALVFSVLLGSAAAALIHSLTRRQLGQTLRLGDQE